MQISEAKLKEDFYPEELKRIDKPPEKLYFRGTLLKKEKCFAIVGTRLCTSYGKQVALDIAGELANAGLTIVSGLAEGIDTCAHMAAVENNKRTIAVLGTGLDQESIYPQSNLKLAEKIIKTGGCLISQYPEKTHGTKFTFPQRNKIIAGLSLGVLVVEAKEKSGALITAKYAKNQSKKIFAIPGNINSQNSSGTNKLIKEGAILVQNSHDILKELGIENIAQKKKLLAGDNEDENLILENLKQGPLEINKIIEKTGLPAHIVAASLSNLEIKNIIRSLGNNIFSLKNK